MVAAGRDWPEKDIFEIILNNLNLRVAVGLPPDGLLPRRSIPAPACHQAQNRGFFKASHGPVLHLPSPFG